MTGWLWFAVILWTFAAGLWVGSWGEARQWRHKGDHDYMNRKESGGRLYTVKADKAQKQDY